ncbi:hypothetical protein AVEN_75660-1 [Araneus ventricosus]|uniref:Uncharacterized protein n=1 Tax=Araneus ventricosus TaxID=182803 RepID=A0A4Y2D4Q3_ARAVE|nr:hypothetical protein AVEN_75660-1 [Araneus ventricosus]
MKAHAPQINSLSSCRVVELFQKTVCPTRSSLREKGQSSARPSPRIRSPTENHEPAQDIGERFMVKEESPASVDLGRPRDEV